MAVEVTFSPQPRVVERVLLNLPLGSTVQEAVVASGLLLRHGWADDSGLTMAVWGRTVERHVALRPQDRVELLRPLRVDPKEARRQRWRSQADRAASRR